jgi:hypothetical protein
VLPDRFDALQIRNSDLKSDLDSIHSFEGLTRCSGPLLLCSDDEEAIKSVQDWLNPVRSVLVLRTLRADATVPLHYDSSIPLFSRNVDLLALAMSRRLWVATQSRSQFSGFSRLARALHANPNAIKNLMGHAT